MRRPIAVLAALIAVLVPAGGLAATVVDPGSGPDRRVSATGIAREALAEDPPAGAPAVQVEAAVTTTAPATTIPPAPTSTVARRSTATTPPPVPGPTTTLATLLPGLPLPPISPILPIPPILQPPASSWSSSSNGVTARMRMEPAAPVPGQPVRFHVEVVTQGACCAMTLSYGDGFAAPNAGSCDSPKRRTETMTHTFAAPGDYELLFVASTFPCNGSVVDGQRIEPTIDGTGITACIGVGRLLGPPTCTPYNHFGPGTVYTYA
jgi:hypothetical protein